MTSPNRPLLGGQCALVTGASSGIGAAIANAFARAGAKVGINYHGDAAAAVAAAAAIRQSGGDAAALRADVSREDDVRSMFAQFIAIFGRLDILVANAGLQQDAPSTAMTLAQWQSVIDVNLTGQFLCAREAIKQFLAQAPCPTSAACGKVICISSVHEAIPWPGHVNYAASKGGVMLMMKTLALEVAGERIRVNGIAPGAIRTKINEHVWSDAELSKRLLRLVPYGRWGEADDVARAAVWLASDEADYVTGTTLFVDGGMTLYPLFRDNG
ncbi:MAG: glucose 1-dehydrogenase [Xanthobacteraceae bacterium]